MKKTYPWVFRQKIFQQIKNDDQSLETNIHGAVALSCGRPS